MNPLELARVELVSPRPAEDALAALEELLRAGLEAGGRRYRLFGGRHGRYVSMSLGMPLLGGGAPVLRAWLAGDAGPGTSRFAVTVGARIEMVVFSWFWLALTVLGGGYQLFLQLRAVATGHATLKDVVDVLPGLGIMVGLLALGFWLFRRRATVDAGVLLDGFRRAVGVPGAAGADPATRPLH